ncbi:MAG: MlaE family lipid ABC transporter permease subunit [Terricaulis sp.]
MARSTAFDLTQDGRTPVLALAGDWTIDTIADLEPALRSLSPTQGTEIDVSALGRFDVAGAYLVVRTLGEPRGASPIRVRGEHANATRLLEVVVGAATAPAMAPEHPQGLSGFLQQTGRAVADISQEVIETASFLGEALATLVRLLIRPRRLRWVSIVHVMEQAGLNALPIVTLLSFFIGLVVAYLGARVLGDFGASVFTVELVAFSMLREFAVVITAVLLAGRTNSAFTAEIGAMKMRQEVDAMRVMGIAPMEALVVPRVLAMLVMTPLLTLAAMLAGLAGGLLVTWANLGVSPTMFFTRISDAVPEQHFWVGMVKAPVFALTLAIIGCKQGLSVGDDVGSLGRRVTSSVVQSIFMVILLDALFALWFLEMDW